MEAFLSHIPQEEIERIADYILQTRLVPAIEEFVRKNELRTKELSLMERIIRVEEELKALREIEASRFEAIEKRIEALQRGMDRRFEAVDKRFSVFTMVNRYRL